MSGLFGRRFIFSVLAIGFVLFGTQGTSAAPLHGAIDTTTPDGGVVNENVRYEQKIEVYLEGGPPGNAPQDAAGLPDGLYVFQVTDPPGKVLLSEDPSKCRVVESEDGVFIGIVDPGAATTPSGDPSPLSGLAFTYTDQDGAVQPCNIQDPPNPPTPAGPDDAGPSGRHDINVDVDHGEDGAIVVQLMPFFNTPNPGGVYKAWAMPLATYQANGGNLTEVPDPACERNGRTANNCNGNNVTQIGFVRDDGFGPPRQQVKTDNFKVKEFFPAEITVRKFHDLDADGIWDAGEPEIGVDQCVEADGTIDDECDTGGGWPYAFTEPLDGGTITNDFFTPHVHVAGVPGTYNATEDILSGWEQSAAFLDGVSLGATPSVDIVVAGTFGETHEVIFGNFMPIDIHGEKFIDLDGDGVHDPGEGCNLDPDPWGNNAGCQGVTVHLDGTNGMGNPVHETTTTDDDGEFSFLGIKPGSYTVTIDDPVGFECSFPDPCQYPIDASSGDVPERLIFGDFSRAEVYGNKYIDLNANGQRDPGETCNLSPDPWGNNAGCQGVTINLDGTDGMGDAVHRTTTTDANGDYEFLNLKPGSYTVTVTEPAGFFCSDPDPCEYDLTLISDEISRDNDFGDFSKAEVYGNKYIDLNANGQRDSGETCNLSPDPWGNNAGCQGVTINLDGTDGMGNAVHRTTTTDANGDYEFLNLKPGSYTITVTEPAGFFCSDPDPCEYDLTLISDEISRGNDFGDFSKVDIHAHKFFDLNEDGVQNGFERDLEGIEFCLYEGATADPANLVSCQNTDADGLVWWMDLMPGTYTVVETLPTGFFGTTPTSVTVTTVSDQVVELEFGNVADCDGLTPGYWKNWRNHYTESQILTLLAGTIAPTIAEADAIFADYDASPDNEMTILRAMLLANQLTLNLTQQPGFPNPSGGNLFLVCQVPGFPDTLGEVIELALEMHEANGVGFTREELLAIKNLLDAFANLNS